MQTIYLIKYLDEGLEYKLFIRAGTAQEALDEFVKCYGSLDIIDVVRC